VTTEETHWTSYDTSCAAERSPPISENLFVGRPAAQDDPVDADHDTPRMKRMPMLTSVRKRRDLGTEQREALPNGITENTTSAGAVTSTGPSM